MPSFSQPRMICDACCGLCSVIDLIERGIVKGLAFNGATAIHDVELAMLGATSEEVADTIRDGRFGMVEETMSFFAEVCERVVVMYAGRIVERAATAALFARPLHPYTVGLLASIPRLGRRRAMLDTIPGMVPNPGQRGSGCYFAERCARSLARCHQESPPPRQVEPGHEAACWNPGP